MHPAARRHPFAALLGAFIGVTIGTVIKTVWNVSTAAARRM